ncbi:hypothetical protein V500_03723 [Pseudogymnoascus sp. VKM F-4518 (FW-2643)]|nr:hypothetical protein V500_03723 [Pseudogymnoascus sp. VKM F-4518 (FW-2643)]
MDGLGAGVLSTTGLHRVLCRHDSPPGHFQRQGRLHMEGRDAQRDSIGSLAGHEGEPCVRPRRVYGPVEVDPVCPRGAAAHRLRPHRRRNPRPSRQSEGSHEDERPALAPVRRVLTLLAIGLDPFAQQLIQYRSYLVSEPSASALVAKTSRYEMGVADRNEIVYKIKDEFSTNYTVETTVVETTELPLSMQSAILTGLSRSPWEVEKEVLVQCPTSNCTWPPFRTLGVCQRCNNVTASLARIGNLSDALVSISDAVVGRSGLIINNGSESPPSTAYSLPNGHFIANVNGCPLYSGYDGNSLCTKEVQEKTNAVYSEEKYSITSFGTGNPNKINTMRDIDTLIWSMSVISPDVEAVNASTSLWPDVRLQATECALYYCVKDVSSSMAGNQLLENITEATDAVRTPDSWHRGPEDSSLGPEYVPPPDEVNSLEFNPRYSAAGYSGLVLQSQDNDTYTNGDLQRWTMVYEIQWPWIALHALTLLLGILFLCITLWDSEHVPLWKSITLATIRRGYELGGALGGVDTVLEMERKAREAYVKVPPSGDGGESAACIRKVQADAVGVVPERVSGSFEGREREAAAR